MKGPDSSSIDLKPNDDFINTAEVILIGLNLCFGSKLTDLKKNRRCLLAPQEQTETWKKPTLAPRS